MLKLPETETANSQNWLSLTLLFIKWNSPGSDLEPGLLQRLEQLHQAQKIVVGPFGVRRTGGFHRLTGKIHLNSDRMGFLKRDFQKQLVSLDSDARKQHIRDQHARAVLELSGVLVHEGAHALRLAWRLKTDETIAFTNEQRWYAHLYSLTSDYKSTLEKLAHNAEYDAAESPVYRSLGLRVASVIPSRNKEIT